MIFNACDDYIFKCVLTQELLDKMFKDVQAFMIACGQYADDKLFNELGEVNQHSVEYVKDRAKQIQLYMSLCDEEHEEYKNAVLHNDVVEIADAICDKIWVAIGSLLSSGYTSMHVEDFYNDYLQNMLYYGFCYNLEQPWNEVKASNMSKCVDGKVIKNEAGKVMKPEGYFKPDIRSILEELGHL